MQVWTAESVSALAPDAASAAAGHALASVKKWASVGRSERAIWGLCQGSGKDPYQARVDLSEPAFKCSCPSRKFPCKHGLGLFLLFAKDAACFKSQDEPGWVSEWIAGRSERAEKKVERVKAEAEKPVDVEAQARRAAQREARVRDGLSSCRVWLEDVVRRGLAAAQTESAATWEQMGARMVDAQAPGLAGLVRRIPGTIASGAGWEARTLDLLGRIHLLLCAGDAMGSLPPEVAVDVRATLGWAQAQDEVLAGTAIADRWISLGQIVEEEDRLRVRRTWLVGRKTGRRALVLDFAAGLAPLDPGLTAGAEFDGELAFYPGRAALRALVKTRAASHPIDANLGPAADATIEAGLGGYAAALAANPWTMRWPLVLARVRLVQQGERWCLVDSSDAAVPLSPSFSAGLGVWRLLSVSGGAEMTVLAEWDGEHALPLGALGASGHLDLSTRWAA